MMSAKSGNSAIDKTPTVLSVILIAISKEFKRVNRDLRLTISRLSRIVSQLGEKD